MTNFLFHTFGGVIAITLLFFALGMFNDVSLSNFFNLFTLYCIGIFFSIFLDVDQRNSVVWKITNVFLAIFLMGFVLIHYGFSLPHFGIAVALFLAWFFIISRIVMPSHRAWMHSIAFISVIAVVVFIISGFQWILGGVVFISMYSHLVLDGLFLKLL